MRARDVLGYSARSLRGHRLRSALSLRGVAIGVASVILLTSLGEGAKQYVTGEFTSLGSNLLIIVPGRTETTGAAPMVSTAPNDLTLDDSEALLQRVPSVRKLAPLVFGTAPASAGERSRDVMVIGTTPEMLEVRKLRIGIGRYLPPGTRDAPICILGAKVQRELFDNRNPLGEWVHVGEARFRVVGVLAPRGTSIGLNMDESVHIPVHNAMRLFDRSSLFRILAEVHSSAEIETARRQTIAVLTERHNHEEDVTILTQDAILSTFGRILGILTAALAGIAAISLVVAGIGIMNVMLVSVSERTREIGLVKALGATRPQILLLFLIEAAVLSTAGGVLGLAFGLAVGKAFQNFVPDFPVAPPWWAVVAALAVSITVGLGFGMLPARRAAALDPIAALARRRA